MTDLTTPVRPRPVRLSVDFLDDLPNDTIAAKMGVTTRSVMRWKAHGIADGFLADRLAVKVCGVDPYTLWGSEFDRVRFPTRRKIAA